MFIHIFSPLLIYLVLLATLFSCTSNPKKKFTLKNVCYTVYYNIQAERRQRIMMNIYILPLCHTAQSKSCDHFLPFASYLYWSQ